MEAHPAPNSGTWLHGALDWIKQMRMSGPKAVATVTAHL